MSSNDLMAQQQGGRVPFDRVRSIVGSEFQIEDAFIEYDVPTFHIKLQEDSKKAFLRLVEHLDPLGFVPVLRRKGEKMVIRAVSKPPARKSRTIINLALFFATLGTVLIAGYFQSGDIAEAAMFAGAIIAILGSHEMGHKFAADKHGIDATYPYFIPGPPPIGTFGAVIQQKSLPPNRDSLFDIGSAGPIIGFLVALAITVIGIPLSSYTWIAEDAPTLPISLLFWLIMNVLPPLGAIPPPPAARNGTQILAVSPHPVALAGYVGMIVTVLNLMPVGMFDGGHISRTFLRERTRTIISYLTIAVFLLLGLLVWDAFIVWAMMAIFFSFMRHPGPLDDTSEVTTWRKLTAVGLAAIFFLSFPLLI